MLEFIRTITSRRDEDGASAVEYGLLVAGIAALIVAVVFLFGGVIKNVLHEHLRQDLGRRRQHRRHHLLTQHCSGPWRAPHRLSGVCWPWHVTRPTPTTTARRRDGVWSVAVAGPHAVSSPRDPSHGAH